MVVFEAGRPVRCKAIFESGAHGTAPAGRACRDQFIAAKRGEDAETIARHRRAALHVQQCGVPGPADLAGEQADAIRFCARGEQWIDETDAGVAQIRSIALTFQAENKLIDLPAVAELSAEDASGPAGAPVRDAGLT